MTPASAVMMTRDGNTMPSGERFSFRDLLERQGSKVEIIVTFLGILELMKTGRIQIEQEHLFDEIYITVCPKTELEIQE